MNHHYIKRIGSGTEFSIEVDASTSTESINYFDASKVAAGMVYDLYNHDPLYLMYSGGVDSEYTLALFRNQGIPVTPVIVRLLPDYNAHDTAYAVKYCQQRNIRPVFIDIDYDRFVESGLMYETAVGMRSAKFQYAATAHAIGQLDGVVLCGDGEPYIRLDPATGRWNFMVHEYEYALTNYYINNRIPGTPHFNRFTKEMFYAFMQDPRMGDLANNLVPGKTSSFSSKWIVYNRDSNFKLVERPKYHGYEGIENKPIYQHESFRALENIGQQWDGVYSRDYFDFLQECAQ